MAWGNAIGIFVVPENAAAVAANGRALSQRERNHILRNVYRVTFEEWFDLFLVRGQRGVDHVVHVVILVRAKRPPNTVLGSAFASFSYLAYNALSASVLIG